MSHVCLCLTEHKSERFERFLSLFFIRKKLHKKTLESFVCLSPYRMHLLTSSPMQGLFSQTGQQPGTSPLCLRQRKAVAQSSSFLSRGGGGGKRGGGRIDSKIVASKCVFSPRTVKTSNKSGGLFGGESDAHLTTTRQRRSRALFVTTKATVDNAESIARKVSRTAAACKTLGRWGFWGQLILFTVAAVVVVFSFLFKGFTKATDAGLYFILFGIMAGFFTTFWSLGLVRLGDRLKASIADLELVPPRAEVVKALTTGLTVNLVGLGATIVGLQATTGLLFAKTLTIAATGPFAQNANPVLALDIFLVQAASNAMLAHWLGMSISLWLLRTVNLPSPPAPKGEK